MRTLQERMNDMKPYFRAIEVYNEALMVRMVFPTNWRVYESPDEKIKVTPSETNDNEAIYYANSNESSYEDIFDLIEETIKVNQDTILKLKLLKEKAEELKELFSKTPFDDLKRLRFVIDEVKQEKPKRKYSKKKKETEIEKENNVTELTVKEHE